MKNPFAPRTHIEVFTNQNNAVTIKVINERGFDEIVVIDKNQIDDMILALQACRDEIKQG